jgi:hypothetical protein
MILIESATVAIRGGKVRKETKRGPENILAMPSSPAPEQHHSNGTTQINYFYLAMKTKQAITLVHIFQRVYPGNI